MRDARINMIFEGTNEILRALVALSALQQPGERLKAIGKAFKTPLQSIGAIGSYIAGRAKRQLVKPDFTMVHPALKDEGEQVAEVIHDLALAVESLLMTHGKEIIEKQFHQERLANAAIDIFLSVCTLSRASAALTAAGGDEGEGGVGPRLRAAVRRRRRAARPPRRACALQKPGCPAQGRRRTGHGERESLS